ncbi:MAG: hypothetical protein UT24_C0015G0008 [Candidatus Woesebacteria bacterium GW2011_GWB1_39_12]|uniref:Uncharacterized protein n=1 Tax=Candidatus Woesebacteria bacterium GW2011_GWB1_39_12 TaxID=1618574 RepID=A0A0G0PPV9_9BACT|nr:MAG: hypothetical protein UT24_C0015G0008 [Candidatus Woesebacteria bacterium GW2011_GWB1_39_12]
MIYFLIYEFLGVIYCISRSCEDERFCEIISNSILSSMIHFILWIPEIILEWDRNRFNKQVKG